MPWTSGIRALSGIFSMDQVSGLHSFLRQVSLFPLLLALLASCGQVENPMAAFETIAQGMNSRSASDQLEG
ncbi:MAG: hypothetical protein ACREIQ_03780, partial [Nitrospiria bacterium]